jgi:4-hydroxyphenylpyruvate dioxygenase
MSVTHNTTWENPVGLDGMEFIEYASKTPKDLETLFERLGFKQMGTHKTKAVTLWSQGRVNFVLNREKDSFAENFSTQHGPSVCATGFRVKNAKKAFETAVSRGARPCPPSKHHSFPAIFGIGDSVIYFIDTYSTSDPMKVYDPDFNLTSRTPPKGVGFEIIDHLTNNVPAGQMKTWSDFYEKIFNFREIRYFDIKGKSTGLFSKAMRSPCGKIVIPINEPTDGKSQIQEYLDEYKGSGIQHIALSTNNITDTITKLREKHIDFLDTPDTYYETIPRRVPNVSEDIDALQKLKILVDGDHDGYLLQIFTKNMIGPIFYEVIQRKGHQGFGEGNFQALFDSIEEDQRRRGYLKD